MLSQPVAGGYNPSAASMVPSVLKRSMLAPHGATLAPKYDQEEEWEEFCERTDMSKNHDFGRYWWRYGRDEDDDGYLREAVFLEVPLRKDVDAKQVRSKLTPNHLTISASGDVLIDEDFAEKKWLNVSESYWEIEVKEVKKVRRKVLRYNLYVIMNCEKYITKWLFDCEKLEDDGRFLDQDEEEDDTVDGRLRVIGSMKEPEPRRDADIFFSETEEEEERWCEGCGSTRIVVMKKGNDDRYMKYCNDCPFVSPAKNADLPTGLQKQRDIDEKRARKQKLKARKAEAASRRRSVEEAAKGEPDRSEEVPEDYLQGEKTRIMTDEQFYNELDKAIQRGDVKWEDT